MKPGIDFGGGGGGGGGGGLTIGEEEENNSSFEDSTSLNFDGLDEEIDDEINDEQQIQQINSSSNSGSVSGGGVKRKLKYNYSNRKRKCRTTFTKMQLNVLEAEFIKSNFVSNDKIDIIVDQTGLDSRIIKVNNNFAIFCLSLVCIWP